MRLISALILLTLGALVGFVSQAHASTITLEQSLCDQASFCSPVANDAGDNILVVYAKQYGRLTVYVNSTIYDSGIWALLNAGDVLVSVPVHDGVGHILYATITFTGGQVTGPCHQSGRTCVFPHAPRYLASGTLVSP